MKRLLYPTLTVAGVMSFGMGQAIADPLYIGAYGGSTEKAMKEKIIPAFLENHDAEVIYVPGNSTDTLAKLQAQAGNQELDVVLMDDGPMYQAINLGFCSPLSGMKSLDDVYDVARFSNDNAVGIGLVATGFAYNAEMFKRNGWAPPSSWQDLADKKFEGKLVVPSISNTYGLHTLVMAARLNGGGENNI
ncbi:extracellular solute-binding protein, partial [Halomonas sp. BBD45]